MEMTRRELNKFKCRQRILKASRKLFSSKGYENTMIEEVAEKADVSRATLYNYFPNKESLLVGIAEEELVDIRRLLSQDLADTKDTDVKIRKVLELLVTDCVSYIDLSRKIAYLHPCEDNNLHHSRMDLVKIFQDLVAEAQEIGVYRKDIDPGDITDLVMSTYLIALFQWSKIESYTPEYCKEKLNRQLDLLLAGIYKQTK